jgi:DNA polymerase III subunit alpha
MVKARVYTIDTDFQHDRRDEVFEFIIQRFGKDHVAQIVTYGTEKLRSGINDLCRTLKQTDSDGNVIAFGQDLATEINKTVPFKLPDQSDPTYAKMKKLAEDPESFRESFAEQTDKMHQMGIQFMTYMKQYPEIDEGLRFIEGLLRNLGKHAAAVVITDAPITDHIPIYKLKKEDIVPVTAFSMKEVDDDLHMLKLDALSLSTMTILGKAQENINRMNISGEHFDIRKIPLDDEDTYKTIRDGNTTGVFQLSGGPITAFTKRVKPWTFNEVVDILALFRPGPLESPIDEDKYPGITMAEKYIENADPQELDHYMNEIPESLRDLYARTRGVLLYQEQILQLAQRMAGYSMGGADLLRRAIGKKNNALLASLKYEFVYGTEKGVPMLEAELERQGAVPEEQQDKDAIEIYKKQIKAMKKSLADNKAVSGSINNGYEEKYATRTFESIELFSRYSFNRSHSLAYALIAIWTAYCKTHYPVEFMAAQLTVQAGDTDQTTTNVQECRRLGIPILPPDVNKSKLGFSIELVEEKDEEGNPTGKFLKAIRYGLESIKGVGPKVINEIMGRPARDDEPESEGEKYANFDDFFYRVDKRIVNKGYIEKLIKAGCFDYDMQNRYTLLNHFYFNLRKDKEFLGEYPDFVKAKKAKKIKSDTNFRLNPKIYNETIICEYELELLGFYLSYHPYADLPYAPWHEVNENAIVDMGGKITAIKKIKTKKGDNMCFVTVETAGGKIEVTVFPNKFTEFQPELFKGNIAIFRGRKQTSDRDKVSMLLDKMLKVKKKKFKIEKPPELEQLAQERKKKPKKGTQLTMEEFEPVVRPDPLADAFNEPADGGNAEREEINAEISKANEETASAKEPEKQESFDLASLFE